MTNERDYWAERRDELLRQMEADEAALNEKLEKIYGRQIKELERDIAAYYQKYGVNNVIEYRKLMVSLSESDRQMLIERMDDFARKYPQYAHLMPVRESIYKLNELEGIQTSIRLQQLEIGAIEQSELEAHFRKQAQNAANLAAEQLGLGSNFYTIDAQVVTTTVGASWAKGKAFSQTIWDNREKLAAYLNDDFAQLIARGVNYETCARELRDRFASVSRNSAKRLIFTEGTFLFNEAQAQVHQNDFEFYQIVCADSRACKICKELQAEQAVNPARFEDRAPGVNFPPLHPWCRCSEVPAVDDWDAWIDDYVAKHGGDAVTPGINSWDVRLYGRYSISDSDGLDTLAKYTVNGKLTPDRQKLHDEILESIFADAVPQEKSVFTIMGGGTASGKSTMINSGKVSMPQGTITIDPDAIKAMIPEYQELIAVQDVRAASYVHEESSMLAKRALTIANKKHFNIALDGTGDGSVDGLLKKIDDAHEAGMRVVGVYATIDTETAIARSMVRALKTGRYVDERTIREIHKKVSDILPQVADKFDDVSVFYTGDEVSLIAKGGSGKALKAIEGKEKLFKEFLEKAKE